MSESNPKDTSELKYAIYLDERKFLLDVKREGTRAFDKAILTLAAGAFGLSLTFVKEIAPCAETRTVVILVLAWLFFCASLLSTLISFLTSQEACSRQIKITKVEFLNDDKSQEKTKLKNRPARWTLGLNISSLVTFVIGTILLAVFCAISLLQ